MNLARKLSLLGLVLWLATASVAAQSTGALTLRISQAKQVILISHGALNGLVDRAGRAVPVPDLVVNGRPNQQVFVKSKALTPAQRTRLSAILERSFRDRIIETMHCCRPHHTIFLVEQGHTSYIDICFACRCVDTSSDISLETFDKRKWKELETLFDELGLSYKFF